MTMLLLDANNLAMRSFHAARGKMSSQGEDTGGLQLFVNALSMHVREEQPDRLVVCWDRGRSVMRSRLLPEYKMKRLGATTSAQDDPASQDLFTLIKSFLTLAGIEQWAEYGVEADDLIAAGWRTHEPGEKVVILSSDKDLLQLLDEDTEQIRFSSSGAPTDRWTRQRVIDELGYLPEQIPLMMALTGDTSDNVPGMKGIGPVKALKMLREASWDLARAMEAHPGQHAVVMRSLACVDLLTDPVVEVGHVPHFRPVDPTGVPGSQLASFCEHYQLRTIYERFILGTLWMPGRNRSVEQMLFDSP